MAYATTDGSSGLRLPRLLVLTSTYPRWRDDPEPGFVHELSKRLAGHYEVTVLGPHAPGAPVREDLDGVAVHRYRYAPERLETLVNHGGVVTNLKRHPWKWLLLPMFLLGQAWAAWRLVRDWRPDVIHAHWLIPQGLIALFASHASRRLLPVVVTSHGADLFALRAQPFQLLKRLVARRANRLTVVSAAMREELARLGVDPARVQVCSMGVDLTARFTPGPEVRRSTSELLFVGRLVEKKGVRHLIDALPIVLERVPDAHLTIAGFGPEEGALRAQVSRLGLEAKVRFVGAVPQANLPALYRRAAAFVAPFVATREGDQEGLGLVLVEALGCGCPTVTTRIDAVSDVFQGEWPAQTATPGSATSLAGAIQALLADQSTARSEAERRLPELRSRFDWVAVAERYAAILSSAHSLRNDPADGP